MCTYLMYISHVHPRVVYTLQVKSSNMLQWYIYNSHQKAIVISKMCCYVYTYVSLTFACFSSISFTASSDVFCKCCFSRSCMLLSSDRVCIPELNTSCSTPLWSRRNITVECLYLGTYLSQFLSLGLPSFFFSFNS